MRVAVLGAWTWACLTAQIAGAEAPCPIVPTPKIYHDTGRTLRLSAAAIVLGDKAEAPERYAAERLQVRFRVVDKQAVSNHATITFLGLARLRAVL